MQKQKRGFWLFIFSLIPGAGEMYMGFKKQGISIMLLFWGVFAVGSCTGMDWLIFLIPIIWFYSFFNVHNLKSLSEEEFYSIDDNYVLHMDQFSGNMGKFLQKHRNVTAWILILFGICILWSRFTALLYLIIPDNMADYVYNICNSLPQIVIAAGIIAAGIYLLTQQKKKLEEEKNKDEHYVFDMAYSMSDYPIVDIDTVPVHCEMPNAKVMGTSLYASCIYYSKKESDGDVLKVYKNVKIDNRESELKRFPGEEIVYIVNLTSSYNTPEDEKFNHLVVLTNSDSGWKLYRFNVIGQTPEIEPEPVVVYSGTGKAGYVMLRN